MVLITPLILCSKWIVVCVARQFCLRKVVEYLVLIPQSFQTRQEDIHNEESHLITDFIQLLFQHFVFVDIHFAFSLVYRSSVAANLTFSAVTTVDSFLAAATIAPLAR